MSKNDISKILKEGSIKQRLRLLTEHYADLSTGGKGILTDKESKELSDSFRTTPEINAYNKMSRVDKAIRPALLALNQYRISYRETIAHITGYVLLWESYKETEELLNSTLWEIKDIKLRKQLSSRIAKGYRYLFTDIELQEDNTIIFRTDRPRKTSKVKPEGDNKDNTLEGIINLWTKRAEVLIAQVKAVSKAIEDWMDENDYKPKPFKDLLKEVENDIYGDYSPYPKYSKSRFITSSLNIDISLMEKYFVYPEPDEIELDEDMYRKFREDYLHG